MREHYFYNIVGDIYICGLYTLAAWGGYIAGNYEVFYMTFAGITLMKWSDEIYWQELVYNPHKKACPVK